MLGDNPGEIEYFLAQIEPLFDELESGDNNAVPNNELPPKPKTEEVKNKSILISNTLNRQTSSENQQS